MVGEEQFLLVNDSPCALGHLFMQVWGMNHLLGCASSYQWNWRLIKVMDDLIMYYYLQVLSWFSCMPVENMSKMNDVICFSMVDILGLVLVWYLRLKIVEQFLLGRLALFSLWLVLMKSSANM